MDLTIRHFDTVDGVNAASWDALDHGPSPFLEHGFLRALERSASIGGRSGWSPRYLAAFAGDRLVGAVPSFVKEHSYGEYIFDFHWARAAIQGGLDYYPKLVVAAPSTPATGHRFLLAPDLSPSEGENVFTALVEGLHAVADEAGCSSIHVLFCSAEEQKQLSSRGFMSRASFQFHWRNDAYRDFDDFLSRLTSRKRKMIRKERERAHAGIDHLAFVPGRELDDAQLAAMERFYRSTALAHGGRPYLMRGFFHALVEEAPDRVLYLDAVKDAKHVAGALFLQGRRGLYGRYWGCDGAFDCLHFEAAYYAGIEHCIENQIPLFEAGAQGEHKLLRGFLPAPTYSAHFIRHRGLARGIAQFLAAEAHEVAQHMHYLRALGPFAQERAPET